MNLAVHANWTGSTLTGVEVEINDHVIRYTTVNIILAKGSYTVKAQDNVTLDGIKWRFWKWEDGTTNNTRNLPFQTDMTITANYKLAEEPLVALAFR